MLRNSIGGVVTDQFRPWTIGSKPKKTFARRKNE